MGASEVYRDDVVVVDELSTVNHALMIARTILQVADFPIRVWWGMEPTGDPNAVLALADRSLFLQWATQRENVSNVDLIGNLRTGGGEALGDDADGSYQLSCVHKGDFTSGVYHVVMPYGYVPLAVNSAPRTRLVNFKKVPGPYDQQLARVALTWLFQGDLEVHIRMKHGGDRAIRKLDAQVLLTPSQATHDDISSLAERLKELPTSPNTWVAIAEILKSVVH